MKVYDISIGEGDSSQIISATEDSAYQLANRQMAGVGAKSKCFWNGLGVSRQYNFHPILRDQDKSISVG